MAADRVSKYPAWLTLPLVRILLALIAVACLLSGTMALVTREDDWGWDAFKGLAGGIFFAGLALDLHRQARMSSGERRDS